MFQKLARHLATVTTKAGNGYFGMTERSDVSPRSTLRVDRRGLHSFSSAEQAAGGSSGALELRIVLARRCTLSAVANTLSPILGKRHNTIRQRLREWYKEAPSKAGKHRCEVDPASCFAPLVGLGPQRLAMPADGVGARCDHPVRSVDRSLLELGLPGQCHPSGLEDSSGQQASFWKPEWLKLLHWFANEVPSSWSVIIMTDRGLYARWLFQAIVALGWHPMMRVTRGGTFLPKGCTKPRKFRHFACRVGQDLDGQRYCVSPHAATSLGMYPIGLLAEGYKDGWYVLTDLPPELADVAWYGLRMWIEHGFEQFKSTGWQWQRTRIKIPERASRMWLAIALATLWAVAVGGEHDHDESCQETIPDPHATKRSERRLEHVNRSRMISVLNQGIAIIQATLLKGGIPKPKRWYPEPWPTTQIVIHGRQHAQHSKIRRKNLPQ